MHLGARVIKTGLAVTISMYLAKMLHITPAVFAAISAIGNLKPSVAQSLKDARQQVIVHMLSVALGIGVGYTLGGNPLTMGLSAIAIILLCLKFNWKSSILMGIVAAIFILDSAKEEFLHHALTRSAGVFIGLGVALIINSLLSPPRYKKRVLDVLQRLHITAVNEFRQAVTEFITLHPPVTPKDNSSIINETRELLSYYYDEIHYNKYFRNTITDEESYYNLLKHVTDYSIGLLERAANIREIIPTRIERRKNTGDLPVSQEFQEILASLETVSATVQRLNDNMLNSYQNLSYTQPEAIRDDFWINLNKIIDTWHHKFSGNYYLHALLEVAIVSHETRWAAREAKKILYEAAYITNK